MPQHLDGKTPFLKNTLQAAFPCYYGDLGENKLLDFQREYCVLGLPGQKEEASKRSQEVFTDSPLSPTILQPRIKIRPHSTCKRSGDMLHSF